MLPYPDLVLGKSGVPGRDNVIARCPAGVRSRGLGGVGCACREAAIVNVVLGARRVGVTILLQVAVVDVAVHVVGLVVRPRAIFSLLEGLVDEAVVKGPWPESFSDPGAI